MAHEQAVEVQIYGQTYRLGGETRDPDHVRRVAAFLDEKMCSAAATAGHRSPLDVAVLAALEIADELLEMKHRKESMLNEAGQRLRTFARRLEEQPPRPAGGLPG